MTLLQYKKKSNTNHWITYRRYCLVALSIIISSLVTIQNHST